ncbi:hypothetical protein GGF46_003743 [Coemansia sp. RSA 552]|nr:hypothetical protein GGF46_003743 [Coemansia sp. RSA 552]
MAIVIGANYGYTALVAAGIALQCLVTSMKVVGARKKYKVDYPDNGSGRYAAKLSDEDWVAFNNIKRVSDNYLENVGSLLCMLLIAGLFQPKLAASLGGVHILGRLLYNIGYVAKGPKGRMMGAPLVGMSYIGLIATVAYNGAMTAIFA